LSFFTVQSQDFKKLKKDADKEFYSDQFTEALVSYQKLLYIAPKNNECLYRAELCKLMTGDTHQSVDNLIKYESKLKEKDRFYPYWLGKIYQRQQKFDEAKVAWEEFMALDLYKSEEISHETTAVVEKAEKSIKHRSTPINYEIENLGPLNTDLSQLSPMYDSHTKSLIFFSQEGKQKKFKLYTTRFDEGEWSEPEAIQGFGSFDDTEAYAGLISKPDKTFIYADLYHGEFKDGKWSDLIRTREKSDEIHTYLNKEENRLLFAAHTLTVPNNLDLFQSTYEDGAWTEPTRLPTSINTHYDEDYPFLSDDGMTLYFSSNGHGSFGGYDIFKSSFDEASGQWSEPITMNVPVNSHQDDIHFKIDEATNSGFYVSNRQSEAGAYDLYLFHDIFNVEFEGTIVNQKNERITNAEVTMVSEKFITTAKRVTSDAEGKFSAKLGRNDVLNIQVSLDGKMLLEETMETPVTDDKANIIFNKQFVVVIEEPKVEEPREDSATYETDEYVKLDDIGSKYRLSGKALIPNIHFGFDQHEISVDGQNSLNELVVTMNEHPELRVEIAGHTDNFGSEEINTKISLKRSQAVVNYLIKKGIKKSRLVSSGYGEMKPTATNEVEENGRALNRRIEVIVIE
jgi:outer membrane protein OmpA-like peptidoglycan-associated protein/tetratricopeptide (TPR) repeat protein